METENKTPKWKRNYLYQQKYDASHTKRYAFKLNIESDKDVIEALDNCGNKQGLVKDAIRFYIANKK